MTREDTEALFRLLKIYFPNSRKTDDKQTVAAWHALLEPYAPPDVKQALMEHMRENKNFPDPQAIAVRCTPVTPVKSAAKKELSYMDKVFQSPEMAELALRHARRAKEYHRLVDEWRQRLGLPTWEELWESECMTIAQWEDMAESAGVDLSRCLKQANMVQ